MASALAVNSKRSVSKSRAKQVIGSVVRDIDAEADHQGLLLTKSFEFVHVSNNLSLVQRKMVNVLLHNAYPNLLTTEVHSISMSVLLEMLGVERNNLEYIKEAFRALVDIKLEWSILDNHDKEDWTIATAIAQAKIKGDVAQYSYAPEVRNKLFDPRMSSIINLIVQNNFTRNFSLALYENVLRYREDGKTVWIPLEIFKKLLGATAKSYEDYKVFNRIVLTPAIKEVNEVSNILLEPEYQREGRKVVAIRFLLKAQNQSLLDLRGGEGAPVYSLELFKRIREFGIGESQAKSFALSFNDEHITKALDYVENRVTSGKLKPESVAGYTVKAIQGGWAKEESKFEREKKARVSSQEDVARTIEAAEQKMAEARRAFARHREDRLNTLMAETSQTERDELQADFINGLAQYETNLLRKNGFASPFITNKFKSTMAEKFLVKPEENDFDVFYSQFKKK